MNNSGNTQQIQACPCAPSKTESKSSLTKSQDEPQEFRMGLCAPLDGMRGISILLVLIAHIQLLEPRFRLALTGGLLGVDAFFVISGFLITSLLLEEQRAFGRISLRNFYIRRALRLLPALSVLLLFTCLLGVALGSFSAVGLTALRIVAILGYFMNWVRAFEVPRPWFLGHLWSLSVEEQFYLVWPATLVSLFLLRKSKVWTLRILICGLGASLLLKPALYLTQANVQRLFFASDTRAEPILIGCMLAALLHWGWLPKFATHNANTWVALVVSAVLLTVADRDFETVYYFGGLTVFAIATALIIASVVTNRSSKLTQILSVPTLVWIGKRSYGIYLWHWPLFKLLRIVAPSDSLGFVAAAVGSTFCVAALSYRYVEVPFLQLKSRFGSHNPLQPTTKTTKLLPSTANVEA
jgi:peptidoglycan/LPS O-acetylase OafA/YrhL